jgi:membrane protease YdiL (CAAX protease family)
MNQAAAKPLIGVRRVLVTCSIAIALAALINAAFGAKALLTVALDGQPIAAQIGWGITFGLAISITSSVIVLFFPPFSSLRRQMLELLNRLDLSGLNPLWFGLGAGIGEELLFRGALQPIVGVWWASLIFTLAHFRTGQFHLMNWQKLLYAIFVFIAGLFLGYVFSEIGLIAAMVTHATVDVVWFFSVQRLRVSPNHA